MTLKERGLAYELPAAQSGTITGDGGVEAPFLGQEWPFLELIQPPGRQTGWFCSKTKNRK